MGAMPRDPVPTGGDRLLVYAIASSDMWFSEVGERAIYLRREPQRGLYLQGEIPQSGLDSGADLSEMLLEYCCGCEMCLGDSVTAAHTCQFAERLGRQLMARLQNFLPETPGVERVSAVMEIIFNSMGVAFDSELTDAGLRYDLVEAPLDAAARGSGSRLWRPLAHRAFVALSEFVVHAAAPDWIFVPPAAPESNVLWLKPAPSPQTP